MSAETKPQEPGWVLGPCPFCSGPPIMNVLLVQDSKGRITRKRDPGEQTVKAEFDSEYGAHIEIEVWRHDCGAKGHTVEEVGVTSIAQIQDMQARAAEWWNTRGFRGIECFQPRRYLPYPGGWVDPDGDSWSGPGA